MFLALAIAAVVGFYLLLGAALFAVAGTWEAPMLWAYIVTLVVLSVLVVILVHFRNPGLLQERLRPGKGEQDTWFTKAATLLYMAHVIIAGLDIGRWHWTSNVPPWLQVAGLVAFIAGFAVVAWAMLANQFFSSAVRLQADRGQQVISSGPYRFVRHPGYTGGIVFLLASGVVLGSWISVLLMLATLPFIIRRTVVEDRMLHQGLAGYPEYAQRVPYRLLPGVW